MEVLITQQELIDSELKHSKEFFRVSPAELGWHYLRKEFHDYEKEKISRTKLCERIMTILFTHKHGLSRSKYKGK